MLSNKLAEELRARGYCGSFAVSDLIESFGFYFYSLERIGPTRWRAQSFATQDQIKDGRLIGDRAEGITPEDALGRLWLVVYANIGAVAA
jgi:hypothetical protein